MEAIVNCNCQHDIIQINLEKGVLVRDSLDQVGLWACLWMIELIKLIDMNGTTVGGIIPQAEHPYL